MKKILIINRAQFGLHTDSFKYAKYLKEQYHVTYLGFDTGISKVVETGVDVIYVSRDGNIFSRLYRFLHTAIKEIRGEGFDNVFVVYFPLCFLFSFVARSGSTKMFCDIRTLSVNKRRVFRVLSDCLLNFEVLFFSTITAISEGVISKLYFTKLTNKTVEHLPLGADSLTEQNEGLKNESLNLFYVGTLNGRNISDTIIGFQQYLNTVDDIFYQHSSYDIVGFGTKEEEAHLLKTITTCGLHGKVIFHGRLNHSECRGLLSKVNLGVCYYPISPFYENQPPTKLFEYILSGIPCISVDTTETRKYISINNGILIKDNIDDFSKGLKNIVEVMPYDSDDIRSTLSKFTWKSIVTTHLVPLLE